MLDLMQLLATIKPEDVDNNSPKFDYALFGPRTAARAIIFDDAKVALIHITKHGYYMLPGGGIEDEDIMTGLTREILEELGCDIEIIGEVGRITVYMDRWSNKQTDYCYAAKKAGNTVGTARTDFEAEEGHEIVWADDLAGAIRLVEIAAPENRDGKLVQARDLHFLKAAQAQKWC